MKLRKTFIGLLSLAILSLSATGALAAGDKEADFMKEKSPFGAVSGKIVSISENDSNKSKMIHLTGEEGGETHITIDDRTYILNEKSLNEGATVTAYYQSNLPMILIYPPRYNALVLHVHAENDGQNIKVDFFDKDLVSGDNSLKLLISEDTEVVTQKGDAYTGDLSWKNLVAFYTVSTKSIPAQTTPHKVVVLSKESSPVIDYAYVDVKVDGKVLDKIHPYGDKGTIMVPVRPVAEALGYDVKWDNATKEVRLGNGISLTIGKDYYVYMRTAPITLGATPTLVDGTTYVPLSFFSEVARASNVEVTLRQVVIDK